jgi:hydrogenase expression/formation protein HypE
VNDRRTPDVTGASCPIPIADYPTVQLAHGGGGRLTKMLIDAIFVPQFANAALDELLDGAVLDVAGSRLAFSTDSFVVRPIFFPGGDIGTLAVNGTVNDLAMCGARPLGLSTGLILEEGLRMEDLWRIAGSMKSAAAAAGVSIVTGDTKVVDRGKGDGVYINTAGIGLIAPGIAISPKRARPGDVVILSGPMAVHGIAIMSASKCSGPARSWAWTRSTSRTKGSSSRSSSATPRTKRWRSCAPILWARKPPSSARSSPSARAPCGSRAGSAARAFSIS